MSRQPIRLVEVNGASSSGYSETRSLGILRAAADRADIVFGCEFANITGPAPLGVEWSVIHDASSPDRAGSLLAVRKERCKVTWHRYRVGTKEGYGIRTRWLIVAEIVVDPGTSSEYKIKVVVGHAPPKRAWGYNYVNWLAFMSSVRLRNADVAGADWNRLADPVARALGRKTRMIGIIGFAVRSTIPASPADPFQVGSDHPAVRTVLYPAN